jgi:hypothetical protein
VATEDSAAQAQTLNTPLGGGNTPKIVPAPASRPANELADTVGVASDAEVGGDDDEEVEEVEGDAAAPAELTESGVTQRVTREPQTVRSQSHPPPPRRRWPLALAPGVALLLAMVIYVSFNRSNQEGEALVEEADAETEAPVLAETGAAEPENDADGPPEDLPTDDEGRADEKVAEVEGGDEGTAASATPVAGRQAPTPAATAQPRRMKSPARATATAPPPVTKAPAQPPVPKPPVKPADPAPNAIEEPSLELQTQ